MKTLHTQHKDNYLVITLDRGRSNPINRDMVADLCSTIQEMKSNPEILGRVARLSQQDDG